ncbi:MAG: peptidase dimerization domain-containing protein [Acidobacteria bacterium]|nr:peptidase dimerization domain-containing protein [Acidobacteriota bacterium]
MNVRGIQAAHVGTQAANIINSEAQASIDLRLVPNQSPEGSHKKVEAHIARQGFFIVHQNPDTSTLKAHAQVVKIEWQSGYPRIGDQWRIGRPRA